MFTTLKIFVDLVDERSFSRAATRNYLTPSAVSQRIQQLEEDLGEELLVRSRGGVTPTEAGRIFYEGCKEILLRYENIVAEMRSRRGKISGRLRLGTVTSVGLHDMPPYIKTFLRQCPEVEFSLEYLGNRDIYAGLKDLSLDLGVVACPAKNPQFTLIEFHRGEMVVIAPREHPLARSREIPFSALEGQAFIAFEEGIPTEKMIDKRLRREGVTVRVLHRFDNIETIKRAVEIGSGISIVPRCCMKEEGSCRNLKVITLQGGPWKRPVAAVHLKSRPLSPAAAKFVEILRSRPKE